MSTLEEMKARAAELSRINSRDLAAKLTEYGDGYTLLANVEADHHRVIAALEAVQQLTEAQPHFQHFGGGKTSGTVLADSITKAIKGALA